MRVAYANSERVPRPWRDGFASLTGQITRPPSDFCPVRDAKILVSDFCVPHGAKIRALTREGRWGGASLTGKRPYYAKASLTGKRPRPPYGGRADLNIFSPADIRGKKIRLFVYSPGAQSLSPVTLLPGMRSFFFHLDIPIKECPRFSTKNAYERTSLASRSPPSGG